MVSLPWYSFFSDRLEVVDRELAFLDRDAQRKLDAFEKARLVRTVHMHCIFNGNISTTEKIFQIAYSSVDLFLAVSDYQLVYL